MANRIVDSVYILDTASANVAIPIPTPLKVMSVRAWFLDTSGKVVLTSEDTGNVICILAANHSPAVVGGFTDEANLGGINIDSLKLPVLTAGTAWIYFG